jgi:hypothetical protein
MSQGTERQTMKIMSLSVRISKLQPEMENRGLETKRLGWF